MRRLLLALPMAAACATSVRDLPVGGTPAPEHALLAGRFDFAGSRVGASVLLRAADGRELLVRPAHASFLVALPAGTYEVRRFGDYRPRYDRLTLLAEAGRARYIGTFVPARSDEGALLMVVRDEPDAVARDLEGRYGDASPALEPGVVESVLPPIGGGPLVVELQRAGPPPTYHVHTFVGYGFGWHHHRHHRVYRR